MNRFNVDLGRDEDKNKQDHPIASREAIYALLTEPLDFDTLFARLNGPKWSYDALSKRVLAMVRDKQLIQKDDKIARAGQSKLVKAKVKVDKAASVHVVIDGINLSLTERHAQGVFPNDEVTVRVPDPVSKDAIAVVVDVDLKNENHIICAVKISRDKVRLTPFDQKIKNTLVLEGKNQLKEGDIIFVSRVKKQRSRRVVFVKLERVLGTIDTPGIEREVARALFALPKDWVLQESIEGADQKSIDALLKTRTSWVDIPLVTIDGKDAKDYDDAVAVEKTDQGYRLYVAIADVTEYVKPGTELDKEAMRRGNSVYFPGYVIPMLPEVLSNDICSLVPKQNRLAMGCCIEFDHQGRRLKTKLDRVVINSHARLIYEDVDLMLTGKKEAPDFWKASLKNLEALANLLREKRIEQGTIVLSSHETKFEFDQQGEIESVSEVQRGFSHIMIEECMLAANMAVGDFMQKQGIPIVYRCHNQPSTEKVEAFKDYLKSHQIDLEDEPSPKELQAVLDQCVDKADFRSIEMMVLRTLSQAYYSSVDNGHYALSTDYYTHFTSPIRRYVDLSVHRAIGMWLDGSSKEVDLDEIAENCSLLERRADEASWFAQGWLKAKWISPNIGKTYKAKISTVTHFGVFVSLEEEPVEGLIHISNLGNEYFTYHADTLTLEGRSTARIYRVGDELSVRLKAVDIASAQVDFVAIYY